MKIEYIFNSYSRIIAAAALFLFVFLMAQPVLANEEFYTNDRVNIRTGPGTSFDKLKTLPLGTEVTVLEHDVNGWSKVVYKDLNGYIKSEFLDFKRPTGATQVSPSGIHLMNWDDARTIVEIGVPIQVHDIRTGFTYYVKSASNGAHADVITLTEQDTEIMKRTFGEWTWTPRPVWVTIGDITIAAAINGMPHGGGALSGTGVNGHFCLHFKGSFVHNDNSSYNNEMQAQVQAAFNAAR